MFYDIINCTISDSKTKEKHLVNFFFYELVNIPIALKTPASITYK